MDETAHIGFVYRRPAEQETVGGSLLRSYLLEIVVQAQCDNGVNKLDTVDTL